jgi:peptidoglycan/LPS O-acetylase OafA/YrhL
VGIFRLLLAIFVLISHLGGGFGEHAGSVAVYAFYVISGYLITGIVSTTYSHGLPGLTAFALNRFLRLYPTYFVVAAVSGVAIVLFPHLAEGLNPALSLPRSNIDAIAQVTIIGLHKIFYLNESRFVPTAWSLNIELIYYALIALVFGRTPRGTVVWWCASAALAGFYALHNNEHAAYFTIWGPSICFASGAMLSHFGKGLEPVSPATAFRFVPLALIAALGFCADAGIPAPSLLTLDLAIPATLFAIVTIRPPWRSSLLKRIDHYLADLSYPLFLCHWPLAVFVGAFLGEPSPSPRLLLATLPLALAVSVAINHLVEAPIRRLRSIVRKSAAGASPRLPPESPAAPILVRAAEAKSGPA